MARPRTDKMPKGTLGTYHIVSRCARRSFLLGGAHAHRRDWIIEELHGLLGGFAIELHGEKYGHAMFILFKKRFAFNPISKLDIFYSGIEK